MAFAVTIDRQHNLEAGFTLYRGHIVADNSYLNGGELIDASGNTAFDFLDVKAPGYLVVADAATQTVKIYRQKDPANAGGADIAFTEVADGVDLSAVPFTFFAIGA